MTPLSEQGGKYTGRGGARVVALISESGLYKLVMRSDKPEAREFQDWVTRVVLPAIRKDGAYIQGEAKVVTGEESAAQQLIRPRLPPPQNLCGSCMSNCMVITISD